MIRRLPTAHFRLLPLALGLLHISAGLGGCDGTTVQGDPGGAGDGGAPAGSSSSAGGSSTTGGMATTSGQTTTASGGGGTGGAGGNMTGGGGAGGVPDPWAGPIESLAELHLGSLDFGAQTPFPIPDKTLGFTLQAEGQDANAVVGVFRLRPPIGGSVIIGFAMTGHDTQVFGGLQHIAAADPQADSVDAYPVKPGDWKVTLGSDDMSGPSADVRLWVRRTNDGAFHGGVIDVNLFVVQGVASQSYMNQVLNAFFPYAGLEKGTVSIYSADPSFSTVGTREELRNMFKATGGVAEAPAINLFVVDNFADSDFGGAIGVAGGIPASPMRHGTSQSGLAYEPSGDPNYDATVLMHEIGHMGGLFHTTEFQVVETDPLSDTPECDSGTIQSNPDQCQDKTNVMFPIAYGATSFTTSQLNVLHGSALYRGILEAGGAPSPPFITPSLAAITPAPFHEPEAQNDGISAMPSAPDPLERALGAMWCGGGLAAKALAIAADQGAMLRRSSAATPGARLRAVALDAALPLLMRKRALRLYFEASNASGQKGEAIETALGLLRPLPSASVTESRLAAAAIRLLRNERAAAPVALRKRIDAAIKTASTSSLPFLVAAATGQ